MSKEMKILIVLLVAVIITTCWNATQPPVTTTASPAQAELIATVLKTLKVSVGM